MSLELPLGLFLQRLPARWICFRLIGAEGMAQLLSFEAFYNFILTMILETTRSAHPDYPALHLGTHQTPCMAMATYYICQRLYLSD